MNGCAFFAFVSGFVGLFFGGGGAYSPNNFTFQDAVDFFLLLAE